MSSKTFSIKPLTLLNYLVLFYFTCTCGKSVGKQYKFRNVELVHYDYINPFAGVSVVVYTGFKGFIL